MNEWSTCPWCGQPVVNNANGWRRHQDDAHGEQLLVTAAAMGFKREEAEPAVRLLYASAAPVGAFQVAMDLARYANLSLERSAEVLIRAVHGDGRSARRLGFDISPGVEVLATIQTGVEGMAAAYAKTTYGQMAVREAQGHTFSRVIRDALEGMFGPR